MPQRIGFGTILSRFPRSYRGTSIAPHQELAPQAKRILEELAAVSKKDVNPNRLDLARFEEGLRCALRWKELESGFNLGEEVRILPVIIARILANEIFNPSSSYGPIYQRELVTEPSEARIWLRRFLYVMEELADAREFDLNEARTFFVRGPMRSLQIGSSADPHFAEAAFPDFNLKPGEFCYIKSVMDNLVALQFRMLDPQERVLKKYAYDRSVPERFSIYSYQEEERRQFDILNHHLLSRKERKAQRKGLKKLKRLSAALLRRQNLPQPLTTFGFRIAGPARRIMLAFPGGGSVGFYHLHLEPQKVYEVSVTSTKIPGTEMNTLAVKFTDSEKRNSPSIHYFDPRQNDYSQILARRLDRKNRLSVPANFIPRIWDDEKDPGITC